MQQRYEFAGNELLQNPCTADHIGKYIIILYYNKTLFIKKKI